MMTSPYILHRWTVAAAGSAPILRGSPTKVNQQHHPGQQQRLSSSSSPPRSSPPRRASWYENISMTTSPPTHHSSSLLRLVVPLVWIGLSGLTLWSVAWSYRLSEVAHHDDRDTASHLRRSRELVRQPRVAFLPLLQMTWDNRGSTQPPRGTTTTHRLVNGASDVDPWSNRKHRPVVDDPTRFYSQLDSSRDYPAMERRVWPHHELSDQNNDEQCEPMHPWQSHFDPVCNVFHEVSWYDELIEHHLDLLSSKGFWRDAWKHQTGTNDTSSSLSATVWRTFKLEHNMEEAFFENARVDAVVMERLTVSPYITNIYGFCAMSVVTEFAGKELSDVAAKLDSMGRLQVGIQVARGLAELHAIHVAYNDLNLANLRMTEDGRPILNDFNIAVLRMQDKSTGDMCPYVSHFPNPQWRAPEEQVYSQEETDTNPPIVTEKSDIYAMGNVLYRLAVGASPWKTAGAVKLTAEEKLGVARLKRENGTEPSIPETIDQSDPPTRVMLQAMKQAFSFDPRDRPTAEDLLVFLQEGLDRIERTTGS